MKNDQALQLTAVIFFAIRPNIDQQKCNSPLSCFDVLYFN